MSAATIANGLTLEYDEHGDGEPLLLVMGLGTQLIAWRPEFVELLAEQGFRVIRFVTERTVTVFAAWEPAT